MTRDDEHLRLPAEFHYVLARLLADAWLVRGARQSPGRHRLIDLLRAARERSEAW